MEQRIIGLTGGIATGKSTVSNYLSRTYAQPILDADVYAREAVTGDVLAAIAQRYGVGILSASELDRRKLARIIFQDATERAWLEAQIHPYVRNRLQATADRFAPATVVMSVPLLFEAGMADLVTETWVVACHPDRQLERLIQRNSLTEIEARQRIASQMPLEQKMSLADIVLDNSGTLEALFEQVDRAFALQPK